MALLALLLGSWCNGPATAQTARDTEQSAAEQRRADERDARQREQAAPERSVRLTELGDTGYVMSIEMGASKESLDHPEAHADIEGVFKHLVSSLKAERLAP